MPCKPLRYFFVVSAIALSVSFSPGATAQSGSSGMGQACEAVGSFIGAIAGYGVGQLSGNQAIAVGLSAAGATVGDDIIGQPCTAAMDDYVDFWNEQNLTYGEYLDNFCNGNAANCPDPLLNPGCTFLTVCDGFPFPPDDPWGCGTLGHCMPWLLQIGMQDVSIQDAINALFYFDHALAAGSWNPTLPPGPGVEIEY